MFGNLSTLTPQTTSNTNVNLYASSPRKRPHALPRQKLLLALSLAASAAVVSLVPPASAATIDWTSVAATAALTGDTSTSVAVANINTAGLAVGQQVIGSGVAPGTTIASIVDATDITLSVATTTTVAANALTFGPTGAGIWASTINWTGGVAPAAADTAVFDLTSYTFQPTVAGRANVYAIVIGDGTTVTAPLTVQNSGGNVVVIGAGGITLDANAGNATISSFRISNSQNWTNNSTTGSVLNITGFIANLGYRDDFRMRSGIANLTGPGAIVLTDIGTTNGILPTFFTFTNGTGTYYATNGGANTTTTAYTAATAVTDGNLMTSATTNYSLNLSAPNVVTANATSYAIRYTGSAQTLQLSGGSTTLSTLAIMNAGTGKLTIANAPGNAGGVLLTPQVLQQSVFNAVTGDIEFAAPVIDPATNTSDQYITMGMAAGHKVMFNEIDDNSVGAVIVTGDQGGTAASGTLWIGSSGNLTLNAVAGNIYLGANGPHTGGTSADNSTGGTNDVSIAETVPGSTVTIMSTATTEVSFTAGNTFTGGLILEPNANLYLHNWTNSAQLGTGPITFMGNNTLTKYLNTFTATTNNRINLDGNLTFAPNANAANINMLFVNAGNAGYGEVHLGANNITISNTMPAGTGTIQFGGLFDDGHGYGITKSGTGNIIIQGSSDYGDPESSNFTGPITVLGGILRTNQYGGMFITSRDNVVNVDTAGTFYVHGGAGYGQQFLAGINNGPSGGGSFQADAASATANLLGGGVYSFSGVVSGPENLVKDGSGTQTFSAANTYAGPTAINGGKLILDFSGPVATAGTNPGQDVLYHGVAPANVTMGGGTLQLTGASGAANVQHIGALSTSGGSTINLNLNGATSLALNAGNITRSTGGTLNVTMPTGTSVLTTASNVNGIMGGFATVNGATAGSADWAVSGATHTAAAAAYDPNDATAGQYDDFSGTGLFIVYTGATLVPVGTAVSFNAGAGTLPTGVTRGAIYYVTASASTGTQDYITVAATPGGTTILESPVVTGTTSIDVQGQLTALPAASYTAFNGATDATNTNLLITGNATLTAATEHINSLKIAPTAAGQSLDVGVNQLYLDDGTASHVGGLLFTGGFDYTIQGETSTNRFRANGGELVINQYGTGVLTISAIIGDSGGAAVTKVGPGKLILSGANIFGGAANLYGGTVEINAIQALGNGTAINFNGGTLRYGTGFTDTLGNHGDITASTAAAGAGRTVTTNGAGMTIDTNGNNITFANAYGFQGGINGTGGLTKIGAGTLTLNSSGSTQPGNGYSGPTVISGGTLALGSNTILTNGMAANQTVAGGNLWLSALGRSTNAPTNLVFDGGTLQYLGIGASTDRNFTLTQNGGTIDDSDARNGALVFTNSSSIATTGSGARTLTLTGTSTGNNALNLAIVDGSGGATSVVKNGTGTWLLNGVSTYGGSTTINSGTLEVGRLVVAGLNGTTTSGGISLVLNQTSGIVVGMGVSGTGIPAGTTITAISDSARVTLSQPATTTMFAPTAQGSINTSGTGNTLTVATTGLNVGQFVSGTGIPANTYITAIGSGTVTLSNALNGGGVASTTVMFSTDVTGAATTSGSPVVTFQGTTGMAVGQIVTGLGIPVATTIVSVDSSTQVTLSAPATATSSLSQLTIGGAVLSFGAMTTTSGSATGSGPVNLVGGTGTLGGGGTIAGTVSGSGTIHPSATLAPTAATTLHVGGLTTTAGATTLDFNLVTPNTAGGSDQIAVTGALNISGGGTLAFTNHGVGQPSLGYYKIMSYGSLTGSVSALTLPADDAVTHVAYRIYTNQDPGFVDVHRGLLGDATDDGIVNLTDFVTWSQNFGQTGKNWGGADFNNDGVTNLTDFVIWSQNFGNTIGSNEVASASGGAASGVPEPASLLLLGAGLVGVLGTRRRVRKS